MSGLLGHEFPAFLASYDAPPSVGLRVNTLKITVEAFRQLAPFDLAPVPWCPAGFEISRAAMQTKITASRSEIETLSEYPAPGKHPYHAAGLYYLQEPSAMAVAGLLAPRPGERVLDLAAAPGGKTTHIAALMQNRGLLVANEVHVRRAWELAGNLERWGARNVAITVETPERLAERFPAFFDAVLADAPCSGEGMMRRGEAARREWAPELVRGCALRQAAILEHAARLVRPGGRLAYSTCTFNPEENEGTIARFLGAHPDFELIELPHFPGFSPGRPEWISGASASAEGPYVSLSRAVRLWPHRAPGEGHFIAVLRRADDGAAPPPVKPWRPAKLPRPVEDACRAFCASALTPTAPCPENAHTGLTQRHQDAKKTVYLCSEHRTRTSADERRFPLSVLIRVHPCPTFMGAGGEPGMDVCSENADRRPPGADHAGSPAGAGPDTGFPSDLALIGSYLYALPAGLPDLTGLRYLHPGWWLGTVKKGRFEPSHALALGLTRWDAQRALDLSPDDPALAAYLRGETLASPGEDGWTLVTVDGYPIGWGKRVAGRLRSHYPKGLRRND